MQPHTRESTARILRFFATSIKYGLFLMLALAVIGAVLLVRERKATADRGGQQEAEPFRIAGDLYYVGASDVTSS